MCAFFKKSGSLQKQWNDEGESFAAAVNEMVRIGETQGWEHWTGKEPEDNRAHVADDLIALLRTANKENEVAAFREMFAPAHVPFRKHLEENGQPIEHLHVVSDDTIVFMVGASHADGRQAHMIAGTNIERLSAEITSIGKSPRNDIFAVCRDRIIINYKGWQGAEISRFFLPEVENLTITQLIPFNSGEKVLLVSSEGIYLLTKSGSVLLHPQPDVADEEWTSYIDMEHASLSSDNKFIALGDQDSAHRILDEAGNQIAEIEPRSSYPHFTLFSRDSSQVILNSCHLYNGITIGVSTKEIGGLKIEAFAEDERYITLDEEWRVYAGVATTNYYIIGDASGYIRAFTKDGKKLWRHFLGSTITGMTVSEDETTIWAGTYAGIIHKLQLGKGHRDKHTIGNGNHYEEFRILFWKNEPEPLIW